MKHSIENDFLKISVNQFGAELSSVYSKKNNLEYLWQGEEKIWSGQSPILFPIVGRLIDDKYTLDGKVYEMPKHGFARKSLWEFIEKTDNSLSFMLKDTEETRKLYPFNFEFLLTFTIEKNRLFVRHEIKNLSSTTLYFSLGAHPAFNCKLGDKLIFEKNETLNAFKIDLEKSLILPKTVPVLKNETDIVITEDIFKEDALIFKGVKSDYVTLKCESHSLRFHLNNTPYLGIWAKPSAPYVCIEPWFGLNDIKGEKRDFSKKEAINHLEKHQAFSYEWSVDIE